MAIKRGKSIADRLTGTSSADQLFGLGGNDTLTGNSGNDLLDGGTGADRMSGGRGNDTYVVDRSTDRVIESAGQGTDTVKSSVTLTIGSNVEHLILTGTKAINGTLSSSTNEIGNSLTGNSAGNVLKGGNGHDVLIGGRGSDRLEGGNGNDTLRPGAGNVTDTIIGGDGFDTVDYRDALSGVLVELSNPFTLQIITDRGASGDVISSVESVTGSRFNDVLRASTEQFSNAFGGGGNDQILGSAANYDRLRGDDENDQLIGLIDSNEDFMLQYDRGMDVVIGYRQNNDEDHILIRRAEFGLSTLPGSSIATVEYRVVGGGGNTPLFTGQQRLAFHTPTSTLWADKDGAGSKFEPIVVAVFDSTSEAPQSWNIFVL